jgi:hypothetical protein
MSPQKQPRKFDSCSASLTVPELEQSKETVLNMLASAHSRRSYKHAIEKFIAWYCSEPRLGFGSEDSSADLRQCAQNTPSKQAINKTLNSDPGW